MSKAKEKIIRFINNLPDTCTREEIIMAIIIADLRELGVLGDSSDLFGGKEKSSPEKKREH